MSERSGTYLHFLRLPYLFMVALSFYLLYISRRDEAYTIWGAVPSVFLLVFFVATLFLVSIGFSPEKTEFKILFIIVHSILSLSFYALVFPFGRTGVPQMVLGEMRLVFDNITPTGLPAWPTEPAANIVIQLYRWARVFNLETLLTVVSARMFGVDIYWSNLLLIPFSWAIFIPVTAHAMTKELSKSDKNSHLASLAALVFPALIFYGSFSSRNGLGFILFYASFYLCLRYISSKRHKWPVLLLFLSLASFLSHFLTGVISFSLLLLATAVRFFQKTRKESPNEARLNLLLAFFVSASLLPLALTLHGLVYHLTTSFGLSRLRSYTITEAIAVAVFGEYAFFDPARALVFGLGSLLGLAGIVYYLRRTKINSAGSSTSAQFVLMSLLVVWFDYRIIKLFMVNVPFEVERLLAFSDLIAVPVVALLLGSVAKFADKRLRFVDNHSLHRKISQNAKPILVYALSGLLVAGWVTASVYYAYPTYGILQTTPYEVEAVKLIDKASNGTYIVIADPWIVFAGEMYVGIHNPRAFYFFYQDSDGISLYVDMENAPSNDTLIEALRYNNADIAYFVIEQPRLGDQEFNRVVSLAHENGVAVYEILGNGKLIIFYWKK